MFIQRQKVYVGEKALRAIVVDERLSSVGYREHEDVDRRGGEYAVLHVGCEAANLVVPACSTTAGHNAIWQAGSALSNHA